jgi:uncharacterized membrane protein AbrB (regulator of aidB expression)
MAKKTQTTKLAIGRWIAVLPITVIALTLFTAFFSELFYKALNTVLDQDTVANIVGYINAFSLPAIIVACAYWVSPKLKFKSCLVLAVIFVALQIWHYFDSEYVRHGIDPYITFYALSYFISLYIAYKLDKKR